MTSAFVRLTIMSLTGLTADRAKASRADVECPSMARRNRAEVVVADEIGVYHCVQRVVRRAFLRGGDPLSGDGLQVSTESWLETVAQFGHRFHRAVGLADHLKAEARRLGENWLQRVRSSQVAFAHSPCP